MSIFNISSHCKIKSRFDIICYLKKIKNLFEIFIEKKPKPIIIYTIFENHFV
jgi:hypothetical protein